MLLSTDQPKLAVDHLEASNEVKPGKGNLTETMEHPETKAIKTDTNSKTKNEKYLENYGKLWIRQRSSYVPV